VLCSFLKTYTEQKSPVAAIDEFIDPRPAFLRKARNSTGPTEQADPGEEEPGQLGCK
jgi:hypothetical protein